MEVMKMLIMDGRESNERKDEENIKIEDWMRIELKGFLIEEDIGEWKM